MLGILYLNQVETAEEGPSLVTLHDLLTVTITVNYLPSFVAVAVVAIVVGVGVGVAIDEPPQYKALYHIVVVGKG